MFGEIRSFFLLCALRRTFLSMRDMPSVCGESGGVTAIIDTFKNYSYIQYGVGFL